MPTYNGFFELFWENLSCVLDFVHLLNAR